MEVGYDIKPCDIFFMVYENKPLRLKTVIEHYFTIKGLSW